MLKRDLDDGIISKTKEFLREKWDAVPFFSFRQQCVLYVITLLLLGSLCFSFFYHPPSPSSGELVKEVVIEVSGEVRSPGVYLFQYPPTLRRAVERAGGLKETVQFEGTSSSEILETGTLLTVARKCSQLPPSPSPSKGGYGETKREEIKIRISRMAADKCLVFSIPLDLNQVSMDDLCLISGIGESLAREMITYRERRRGFRSVEDLKNVRGIGEKKYQSLKGFFTTR
jgi:competence protein ComEA